MYKLVKETHMVNIFRVVIKKVEREVKPEIYTLPINFSDMTYREIESDIIPRIIWENNITICNITNFCPRVLQIQWDSSIPKKLLEENLKRWKIVLKGGNRFVELMHGTFDTSGADMVYSFNVESDTRTDKLNSCYVSAGMMKNNVALFVGNCSNNQKSSNTEINNKLTFGARAQRLMMQELLETIESSAALAKPVARDSLHIAPGRDYCPMPVYAIYAGKFGDDLPSPQEYEDGSSYTSAFELSRCNEDLSYSDVLGSMLQIRPGMSKCTSECMPPQAYRNTLKRYSKNGVIYIIADEVTDEQQVEFNKLFIKGQKSEFRGKLIVVARNRKALKKHMPTCLLDLNAQKDMLDLSMPVPYRVIGYAHAFEHNSNIKTSVQLFRGLFDCDAVKANDFFDKVVENHSEAVATQYSKPDFGVLTEDDLEGNVSELFFKLLPSFSQQYLRSVVQSKLNGDLEGLSTAVNNHSYNTPGCSLVLGVDPAFRLLGIKVLDFNKEYTNVFIPELHEYFGNRVYNEKYAGIKYPNSHSQERMMVKPISKTIYNDKVVRELIKKVYPFVEESNPLYRFYYNEICKDYKWFFDYIDCLGTRIMFVPASKLLMASNAGYDFDGDKVSLYLDTDVYDIYSQKEGVIQILDTSEENIGLLLREAE